MNIAKVTKRLLLAISGTVLLSAVSWGQDWGPQAAVQAEFGGPPARFVEVDRRWDDRRWERERREERRRCHRREERREYRRGY